MLVGWALRASSARIDALRSAVGQAAKLEKSAQGPIFRRHQTPESAVAAPPIAPSDETATTLQVTETLTSGATATCSSDVRLAIGGSRALLSWDAG
jgi:hypothetical protein